MKHLAKVCLLVIVYVTAPPLAAGYRCKRGSRLCYVRNEQNRGRFERFDTCTHICCGGEIVPRDVSLDCCGGSSVSSVIYDTRTQVCCQWKNNVMVYNRSEVRADANCCGTQLLDREQFSTHACCNSYSNEPAIFNYLTEMCCNGNVGFAGNTAYTQCCGDTTFDRRVSSCPCQDNVVHIGIPHNVADCCYGPGGIRNAYNRNTQDCCAGRAFERGTQFCCGTAIGNKANQTCCGNSVITPINEESSSSNVGCCRLADGRYVAYNTRTEICCGESVQQRNTSISQICCGNTLYNTAESGSMCCGAEPYFHESRVCCEGGVEDGDACCNGRGFDSRNEFVCCDNRIVNGTDCCGGEGYFGEQDQSICCQNQLRNTFNFAWPACCVENSFDASVQTCCGSEVFDNPIVGNGVSNTTRCCEDTSNGVAFRPYDYYQQVCCNGGVADLNNIVPNLAVCCGTDVLNQIEQLCCGNNPVTNSFGENGECCGDNVINTITTICCNGEARNRTDYICCGNGFAERDTEFCCNDLPTDLDGVSPSNATCCDGDVIDRTIQICCNGRQQSNLGIPDEFARCCGSSVIDSRNQLCCDGVAQARNDTDGIMCCGQNSFNPSTQLCCGGEPRDLNGIPVEDAICCGDGCIDGRIFWCCKGQLYRRGAIAGENIESLTCRDAFL